MYRFFTTGGVNGSHFRIQGMTPVPSPRVVIIHIVNRHTRLHERDRSRVGRPAVHFRP